MHRSLIALSLSFGLILSASGSSVEFPVTRTNLDQYKYLFSVSTNATRDGVAFHLTVSAKAGEILSDSTAGLAVVNNTKNTRSIEPVPPATRVTLKKDKRVWKANFTVSAELLKQPGLCFVFTETAHATADGKSIAMPSEDLYEIRLQDFLNQ